MSCSDFCTINFWFCRIANMLCKSVKGSYNQQSMLFLFSPRDSFDGRRPLACTETYLRCFALLSDMKHVDLEIEKTICGFGEGIFLLISLSHADVTRLCVHLNPQRG